MATIMITEFMEFEQVNEMSKIHKVIYEPEIYLNTAEIIEKISNIDALIVRNKTKVSKNILSLAKNLKVIGRLGVGLDNIDIDFCKRNKISVIIAEGANANSVCEYVLMGILTLFRGTRRSTEKIINGEWDRKENTGFEIENKILGIVGIGTIGRIVAKKAGNLGMKLIGTDIEISDGDEIWNDLNIQCASIDEVLQKSDVISLHVPLTKNTKNLFGKKEFEKMQKGSFIINTSRGGIIDEKALLDSLNKMHLGGAMLDVFENEPLNSPNKFAKFDNVILTPHIAGLTNQSNSRVSKMITKHILDFLKEENA
mgnify:CR=1 FL=1